MRFSLGILGALLCFQSFAGSCLLSYDPFGLDGKVPFVHSLTQVSRDQECSSVIFYPPIPRLGYINAKTGIQKIPFDTQEKRELVLDFLTHETFVDDVYEANISEEEYAAFQKSLKDNEQVTKSITLYHGSPLSIAPTEKPHQSSSTDKQKEVTHTLFQKDQWSYADLLTLTQSDKKKAQGLIKMLNNGEGESYINPCAKEYQKLAASLELKVPPPNETLFKEAEKLATEYKSLTQTFGKLAYLVNNQRLCSLSEKAFSLLQKHYAAPKSDEAYCKIRETQTLFYFETVECFNKLKTNLLKATPLSGMLSNSQNLVLSCLIGKENVDAEYDAPFRNSLQGCPEELAAIDSRIRLSRKNASQKSARLLCEGAAKGAKISVGLVINQAGQTDSKVLPATEETNPESGGQASTAEEIFQALVYASPTNCTNSSAETIQKYTASTLRAKEIVAANNNVAANDASLKKLREFTKNYCHSEELLSEEDKASLKKALYDAHSFLLYENTYGLRHGDPNSRLYDENEMKKWIKYHELDAQLKTQYDKVDLSTKTSQVQAAKRLLFLKEEGQKGSGFFDCYECDGNGNASLISCKKLKRSFRNYALIGERSDLEKLRDPLVVMKKIEASINSAGQVPLPVCNTQLPPCKFNEDCAPEAPSTHTTPAPAPEKTIKEKILDYFQK